MQDTKVLKDIFGVENLTFFKLRFNFVCTFDLFEDYNDGYLGRRSPKFVCSLPVEGETPRWRYTKPLFGALSSLSQSVSYGIDTSNNK